MSLNVDIKLDINKLGEQFGGWFLSLFEKNPQIQLWLAENTIKTAKKYQEICEQQNINRADAERIATKIQLVWLETASTEDDENIQDLLARILAEGTKDSDNISVRTLKVINGLTNYELVSFKSILRYASNNKYIYIGKAMNEEILSLLGIQYNTILLLSEAGLLSNQHAVRPGEIMNICGYDFRVSKKLNHHGPKLVFEPKVLGLTTPGLEIARALTSQINTISIDDEYFNYLIEYYSSFFGYVVELNETK